MMIKLKNILLEDSPEKVFGKAAFAYPSKDEDEPYPSSDNDSMYKAIRKLQGIQIKEPNTENERVIFNTLIKWVKDASTSTADNLYKDYELFKQAAKSFPQIFNTNISDGTTIYRAINANSELFSLPNLINIIKPRLLSKEYTKIKIGDQNMTLLNDTVTYDPHMKIQSWTTSKKIASIFIDDSDGLGVLVSSMNNNEFLFNPKFFKCIANKYEAYNEGNEYEVLHFGTAYSNKIKLAITDNHKGFIERY